MPRALSEQSRVQLQGRSADLGDRDSQAEEAHHAIDTGGALRIGDPLALVPDEAGATDGEGVVRRVAQTEQYEGAVAVGQRAVAAARVLANTLGARQGALAPSRGRDDQDASARG